MVNDVFFGISMVNGVFENEFFFLKKIKFQILMGQPVSHEIFLAPYVQTNLGCLDQTLIGMVQKIQLCHNGN